MIRHPFIRHSFGIRRAVYRRGILAIALLCAVTAPVLADDTILRLSETATVMVTPDQLSATLRAEAVAPTAQDAQKRVNEMMRDAVASAKKVDGIAVATGGYNVWRAAITRRTVTNAGRPGRT